MFLDAAVTLLDAAAPFSKVPGNSRFLCPPCLFDQLAGGHMMVCGRFRLFDDLEFAGRAQ
jgi:hypothetical protein